MLTVTTFAAHANSVDMKVVGTVLPSACTPVLSGGGNIDYGNIQPSSLSKTDYTVLPEKRVNITVNCNAPTRVAISATNMRPGSLAGVSETGYNSAGQSPVTLVGQRWAATGLGLHDSGKIGGYAAVINPASLTADGAPASAAISLGTSTPGTDWIVAKNTSLFHTVAQRAFFSWADGSGIPIAATTFNATIDLQAYINKLSELNTATPITLDGQSTIELYYI